MIKGTDYWQNYFTQKVLPKINKGWKYVAIHENKPCINCYAYSDCIRTFCINHHIYGANETFPISFEYFQKYSNVRSVYTNAIDFEKHRQISMYASYQAYFSFSIIRREVELIE